MLCKICNDVQKSLPFSDYFEVIFVFENAAVTDEYDRRGKGVPTFCVLPLPIAILFFFFFFIHSVKVSLKSPCARRLPG